MRANRRSIADSLSWLGEQAQTQFLDRNFDNHQTQSLRRSTSPYSSFHSYNSIDFDQRHTIRFQVIVWSVGIPDVKSHTVSIMFRVTLFWNDPPPHAPPPVPLLIPMTANNTQGQEMRQRQVSNNNLSETNGESNNNSFGGGDDSYWVMDGRRKAIRRKRTPSLSEPPSPKSSHSIIVSEESTIDVPPISIINADTFEVIGQPDITMLNQQSRLMRFSCMYRARLQQESMNVSQFPHDSHDLVLKLGILAQRHPGGRWDRRKWKLGLANDSDTQGSVRVPFGVLVDHVAVPGFQISKRGLEFEMSPIDFGIAGTLNSSSRNLTFDGTQDQDFCLKAKIRVKRNSAYYDRNIMPLLDILNLVSISILVSLNATHFFQRGLLCLNIAFLEIGLRTSLDARLPSVGYEIKMQKLLNSYFFSILYIVLESAAMKFLVETHHWPVEWTQLMDHAVAFLLLINQFYLRMVIFKDFSAKGDFNEFS